VNGMKIINREISAGVLSDCGCSILILAMPIVNLGRQKL